MGRKEKLLKKAYNNPKGLKFNEFESLLSLYDWKLDRQRGSHRLWISPGGQRLPVQKSKNGMAKGYQVEQFLNRLEKELNEYRSA